MYYTTFKTVIAHGGFNLSSLLNKIDVYHIEGKLTDEQRNDLRAFALDMADIKKHPEYLTIVKKVKEELGLTEEEQ